MFSKNNMLLPMYRPTYVLPLQYVWIFQGETEIDDHSTISLVHGALNHTCRQWYQKCPTESLHLWRPGAIEKWWVLVLSRKKIRFRKPEAGETEKVKDRWKVNVPTLVYSFFDVFFFLWIIEWDNRNQHKPVRLFGKKKIGFQPPWLYMNKWFNNEIEFTIKYGTRGSVFILNMLQSATHN